MRTCNSRRSGFTLVELLVVLVIIGVLTAIAIPKFARTKDRARVTSIKSDLRNYATMQEVYHSNEALTASTYALSTPFLSDSLAFRFSKDNIPSGEVATTSGYKVTLTNSSIAEGINSCSLAAGSEAATPAEDGEIVCTVAAPTP